MESRALRNVMIKKIAQTGAILLFAFFTALPFLANEKQKKIVIVKSDNQDQYNECFNGFLETLEQSGIPFQTKIFTLKIGDQQMIDSLTSIDSEHADAILTIGSTATREVSKRITHTPVYFTMVLNPEKNVLTGQMPAANLSGVRLEIPVETQLTLIKQIFTNLKAIGMLYHPVLDSSLFRECLTAAQKLNVAIVAEKITSEEDIPSALKETRTKSNVLLLIPNQYALNYSSLKYILMYALSNNFPVIGLSEFHVKAGALLAIRADYHDAGKQAGDLIVDLFSSQRTNDQVIYGPRKTKLFINKRTADMMGIAIPIMFLSEAEQVYE